MSHDKDIEAIREKAEKFISDAEEAHGEDPTNLLRTLITTKSYLALLSRLTKDNESELIQSMENVILSYMSYSLGNLTSALKLSSDQQKWAIEQADIFYALMERELDDTKVEH
jgi:hypothetical protein